MLLSRKGSPTFIGKSEGFGSRTRDHCGPSRYLPEELVPPGKRRSPVTQSLIERDILEFGSTSLSRPNDKHLDKAIAYVRRQFALPTKIRPFTFEQILQSELDIWDKSPGLPWSLIRDEANKPMFKTKKSVVENAASLNYLKRQISKVKYGESYQPPDCQAFVRAHICDVDSTKVRAVWGYPLEVILMEAHFAVPLIRAYQQLPTHSTPIAYGLETATGGAVKIIKRMQKTGKWYYGLDFKKFDKSVPAWLLDIAYDVILENLDLSRYDDGSIPSALRLNNLFEFVKSYMINTPIRTSTGKRFRKSNGVASGTYFTQLIGSICNAILISWMINTLTGRDPEDLVVLGDDSLFPLSCLLNKQDIHDFFIRIGMEINLEKSQIESSISKMKFLGYTLNNGLPMKSHDDWLTALVFPEYPDESFSDVQSRALGLYYASMCFDGKFASLCHKIITMKEFEPRFDKNFIRHLKHIGYNLEEIKDVRNLPNAVHFARKIGYFA